MTPQPEEVSFKRVTQGEGEAKKHYFVMCTLRKDDEDFEKSLIDLAVTSEHACWQAQGQSLLESDRGWLGEGISTAESPSRLVLIIP